MEYEIDNTEASKKADNRILSIKKEIDEVDNQIDYEKNKLQELADMQESVDEIADNINKCIELLSKSIKGPTTENMFSEMYNSNKTFQTKVSINIENDQITTRQRLNELYKEKDNILEDNKNEYHSNEITDN